jgi:ABC-type tungstate transport system permease subunit
MQTSHEGAFVTSTVIDENAGLHQFYAFTATLSNNKHVRFIAQDDEVENIEWHFKYRGRQLTLQYNIYNGVSVFPQYAKDQPAVQEIVVHLKKTA